MESFGDEGLMSIEAQDHVPWYDDVVNYLVCRKLPLDMSFQARKRFMSQAKYYHWEEPLLYRNYNDGLFRRCVPEDEMADIMKACHSSPYGGHFGPFKTATKILQSGFY